MTHYDPQTSKLFMFTLSTGGYCRRAKKFFNDLGVPFEYVDVDRLPEPRMDETLAEMSRYNPAQTFPTVISGKTVVAGFREDDLRRTANKLRAGR